MPKPASVIARPALRARADDVREPRHHGAAHLGLEGFEVLGWFALLAPAKTPQEIVRTLNAELNKMISKPQIVAKFAELGAEPLGGTPERAAAFIRAEQEKWGRIIRGRR